MKSIVIFSIVFIATLSATLAKDESVSLEKVKLERIKEIKSNFFNKSNNIKDSIHTKVEKLDTLLMLDTPEESLRMKFEEIKQLRERHQNLRFLTILEMRKVLPKEYWYMIKSIHHKHGRHRQGQK